MRRYKAAIRERNIQVEAHRGFTATLSEELVSEWERMCVVWEKDSFPKQAPNPYRMEGISECVSCFLASLFSLLNPSHDGGSGSKGVC
jgi:hypothetical protein